MIVLDIRSAWISLTRNSTMVWSFASGNEIFVYERNGMSCNDINGMKSTNTFNCAFHIYCLSISHSVLCCVEGNRVGNHSAMVEMFTDKS